MAADISSIMQLLQRQAALVPPAYSTVSSPHQPPGPPPCPLQPVLPITPIQPLSQVSTPQPPQSVGQTLGSCRQGPLSAPSAPQGAGGTAEPPPQFGAAPSPLLQPQILPPGELGGGRKPPTFGAAPLLCPILHPQGEVRTRITPQVGRSPPPFPPFPPPRMSLGHSRSPWGGGASPLLSPHSLCPPSLPQVPSFPVPLELRRGPAPPEPPPPDVVLLLEPAAAPRRRSLPGQLPPPPGAQPLHRHCSDPGS